MFTAALNRWMSAYGEKIEEMCEVMVAGEMRKEGNRTWKAPGWFVGR